MTTTPITNLTNGVNAPPNTRVPAKSLGQSDFLKLMITELQNQDPLKPNDSSQMLAEMSQISTVQAMTQVQTSFTQLQISQQLALGQGLINKTVQIQDPTTGNDITGVVQQVKVAKDTDSNGVTTQSVNITVNGSDYPIKGLESVIQTAAAPTTP